MKNRIAIFVGAAMAFMLTTVAAQVLQRPLNPHNGKSAGITYFRVGSEPSTAADGEVAVRSNPGAAPELLVYDGAGGGGWTPLVSGGGSGFFTVPDDTPIYFGTDEDVAVQYVSATSAWDVDAGATNTIRFEINGFQVFYVQVGGSNRFVLRANQDPEAAAIFSQGIPVGTEKSVLQVSGPGLAMNGSDEQSGVFVNLTNSGGHTGSGNTFAGVWIDDITGHANADEYAIFVDTGWDATMAGDALRFRILSGTLRVDNNVGTQIWTTNVANSTTDMQFTRPITAAGDKAWVSVDVPTGFAAAMDGDDRIGAYRYGSFTDQNHTGSNNVVFGFHTDTITSPDGEAIHTTVFSESASWDAIILADVDTDGWSPTGNPNTNNVAIYVDESADRGAGTATADCAVIVRLASGTEIALTPVLVTDGGC